MSGVLHRLAAQAMGQGNAGPGSGPGSVVRAAARLAFSAAPDLVDRAAPAEPPAAMPIISHHIEQGAGPLTNAPMPTVRDPAYPGDPLQQRRRNDELGFNAPPEIAGTTQKSAPESLASLSTRPAAVELPGARLRPLAGQERDVIADAAAPLAPSLPSMHFPDSLLPAQSPAPSIAPAVALPWAAGTPMMQQGAQNRQPAAVADPAGDVHVTIGCIEITAVHEAPRAKQPARHGAQPMTLDDYLTRRQGGRR